MEVALTRRRARGAASGVPGATLSLGVSEVELSDELLLESSLLGLLVVKCRMEETRSEAVSRCSSVRWPSCLCLCTRSLAITCESGMPNAWGANSVRREERDKWADKEESWKEGMFSEGSLSLAGITHQSPGTTMILSQGP